MRLSLKMLMAVGLALLFAGCAGNTAKPMYQQQKVVRQAGGSYYYSPVNAVGVKMDNTLVYLNKVTSSGLLQCKKGYALLIDASAFKKETEIDKKYWDTLTPAEILAYRKDYTKIPRINSKAFQDVVRIDTKLVRAGKMACIPPMTKKQVKQYKAYQAQQAKINNDPRVIAARANQSAAMMNYQAATAPRTVNYNVNHSGFVNYSGSVYHYGY
jgi:ribosomal 30S subunit maturation factor RimM